MNNTEFIIKLIENPNNKKSYIDFKNLLINLGKAKEANTLDHLIQRRFNVVNNTDSSKK
jgi:hypothetical protein